MSEVIFMSLKDDYMPVPTKKSWLKIAEEYSNYRQIPNCLGSIDGKHIQRQTHLKRAHRRTSITRIFFSMVLMVSLMLIIYLLALMSGLLEAPMTTLSSAFLILENVSFQINWTFHKPSVFQAGPR